MQIIPAIDLIDNKVVRLKQGRYDSVTNYECNPVSIAEKFQNAGAELIHIVDLQGARSGDSKNINSVKNILDKVNIKIEFGGGVRSLEKIDTLIKAGVHRVIIGTKAASDENFIQDAVAKYAEKIVIGIDAKDGIVMTDGWEKSSGIPALKLAKKMADAGVKTIIYTDIKTDGMLKGPNLSELSKIKNALDIDIIASGGISSLSDIAAVKAIDVSGVIIGKAIYENKIDLREAIKIAE